MLNCTEGFGNKVPPFLGNVRIVNFDLDKYITTPKEKVTATGKAEIKKFTPLNNWKPFTEFQGNPPKVEIYIKDGGGDEPDVRGKITNPKGWFSIEFEPPQPVTWRSGSWGVVVHLPEPSGGFLQHHLSCGPIGLTVVPEKEDAKAQVIGK